MTATVQTARSPVTYYVALPHPHDDGASIDMPILIDGHGFVAIYIYLDGHSGWQAPYRPLLGRISSWADWKAFFARTTDTRTVIFDDDTGHEMTAADLIAKIDATPPEQHRWLFDDAETHPDRYALQILLDAGGYSLCVHPDALEFVDHEFFVTGEVA